MLVAGFPAGSFAANCYVVATAPGEQCVIIDPGQDAQPGIEEILAEHRLQPAAVLLTHGHLDHVWSVAPVCGAAGIPAYIHPADRDMLSDPGRGLSLGIGQELFGGLEFTEPDDVKELTDGMTLSLVGLEIVVNHAPGHTEGSVAFRLPFDVRRMRLLLRRAKAEWAVPRTPVAYCFPAICCSPDRSGGPTCPAGTTPRSCAAWPASA